ncbi:MAG: hypothetical protein ACD_62C00082G0006 [uncultured bacterium]|nr:MAG: hypothetical protein ACD_62C00082G0006 [uncultured bacterium]
MKLSGHVHKSLIFFLVFALFFIVPVSDVYPEEVVLSDVVIAFDGPKEFKSQLNTVVPYKKGQVVNEDDLRVHFEKMRQSGLFSDITYELLSNGIGGQALKVDIHKALRVRNVNVDGNYPILAKNIKKLIALQPGTDFQPGLIPESVEAIRTYLEKNGFFESRVDIEVKREQRHDVVDLLIRIHHGVTYHIDQIFVTGTHQFSEQKIRRKVSQISRFRINRLKKNLTKIKKMYARHGYIKARVSLEGLVFHNDTRKVDLYLKIRENKKFKLQIEGNSFFPQRRLQQVTKLAELRSYDRYAINNGKERLQRYYEQRGFPNAQIASDVIKPDKKSVIAKYSIEAGKRVALSNIHFDGNDELGTKKLKKVMASQESSFWSRQYFNQDKLWKDRDHLQNEYTRWGFFEAQVAQPTWTENRFGDQKSVLFQISEGPEYRLGEISVASDEPVVTGDLLEVGGLKEGKAYQEDKVEEARARILDALLAEGYAYADVAVLKQLAPDAQRVNIEFSITRGPRVVVRTLVIDGHLHTREAVIRKNLKIKQGENFVYQKMLDGQLNLRKLGAFASVRITPVGFEERQTGIDLVVNVVERKSLVMNLQGGFDSRHWGTGEFNLTKYNLFGTGRQLNMRLIGGPKYDRGEVTFYSPRVFGANWNLSTQAFGQYEDEVYYAAASYGAFASTLKNFGPHWTFGFKEQVSHTSVFESISDIAALGDSLFDNTFNEFQLSLLLDLRDNFSDPQRGIYALAQNELNTDLSNVRNNFNTVRFSLNHYHGFFKRFTLVNTIRYGHTFELANDPRIPVNKLFFMGGSDTMRGFTEDGIDPSGGTLMMIYNTELQLRLTQAVKLAGFFDAGLIGDDVNAVTIDDVRESAGVGFRYFTPIGPIRLDWGFILDRRSGEPTNRIHFSFGYFF